MRKTLLAALVAIAALALPAFAVAHGNGSSQAGTHGKGHAGTHGQSHKCSAHKVGYVASGTVTAVALTQTAGQDTPNDSSDDRYSGTLSFDVKHANHHARGDAGKGNYTLTNARIVLGNGVTAPAAGQRVKVTGKITTVAKKCTDKSSAGQVTIRQVVFHAPQQSSDTTTSG